MRRDGLLIGQRLVRAGIITDAQLSEALALQVSSPEHPNVTEILTSLGYTNTLQVQRIIAEQSGTRFVEQAELLPDPVAIAMIPRQLAEKYHFVPLAFDNNTLTVAMADPRNIRALDDLRIVTGCNVESVMALDEAIDATIAIAYTGGSELDMGMFHDDDAEDLLTQEDLSDIGELTADSPTVKLVNYVIQKAVADGASDIHFEPQEHDLRIRLRVDGVLHEMMRSPKSTQTSILSRLKIMSDLDISETRKPQDGHCAITVGRRKVDFRVSSLPTTYGERIVMRILRTDSVLLQLSDLGFSQRNLTLFETAFRKPYGAILVTGPTGSGKSTSLYAAVNMLNTPDRHILTAEDPVEYRLPGVNQTQMNPKAGLTFARALRSFLRCSPNVILVGEIRDKETAQIATEAALTGHLVLSTLHTNDAPSTITRLTEMGVEPFLVSSAIDTIVAQRLARTLCPECKTPYSTDASAMIRIGFSPDDIPATLFKAAGCRKCNNTGYKGRTGVHEILQVTETIGQLTVEGATGDQIKRQAVAEGMQTLRQDGLEKVRAGVTSVEEIMRVIS